MHRGSSLTSPSSFQSLAGLENLESIGRDLYMEDKLSPQSVTEVESLGGGNLFPLDRNSRQPVIEKARH